MKKKLFGVFTAFIMVVGTLLPVLPVEAAPYIPKKIETFYFPKTNNDFEMDNWYRLPDKYGVYVDKCKSSDPSVAVVKETESYGGQTADPYIEVKKPGTTNLKIVVSKNGVKKTYKVKFTAKKYKNPLKIFKIGKKNYTKKYNKTLVYGLRGKKNVKGKLKIAAAKGYKIKKIKAVVVEHLKGGYRDYKDVTYKNNDKVDLPYASEMYIYVQNKKTKKIIELKFHPGYAY